MAHRYPDSVFDVLDDEFHRLIDGGFRIDGRRIDPAIPQRLMTPMELKSVLLHPSTSFETRDVAWRYLIEKARKGGAWTAVALGMLQPGMRKAAGKVVQRTQGAPDDVDSEFLTGVIEALATIDLSEPRLVTRLISAGIDRARRIATAKAGVEVAPDVHEIDTHLGHPETALWRAVDAKVITAQEAELIASTRLDSDTIAGLAGRYGMTPGTLRRRRNRAETRLHAWIRESA